MRIHSLGKLAIVALAVLQLSSCAVVAVGGVAAGAAIMADRRTPGVQAIDKGIELEANNALAKKFGDNAHINVTSFNQKVLLTGEVKDADIKGEAGAYAKAMKNARSVFNELIIGPNSSYTSRANDSYLESKIKTQMIFTEQLPSNSMAIVAEGSSGRTSVPLPNGIFSGIPAKPFKPLPRKSCSNTVSSWSSRCCAINKTSWSSIKF